MLLQLKTSELGRGRGAESVSKVQRVFKNPGKTGLKSGKFQEQIAAKIQTEFCEESLKFGKVIF